jgi:hypothetical protein
MQTRVGYKGATNPDNSRGPSPSIWSSAGISGWEPGVGSHFFDDFKEPGLVVPTLATPTAADLGNGYKAYNTGSGTVTYPSAFNGTEYNIGILAMNVDTAADQGCIMRYGRPLYLTGLPSTSGKAWFEARIATTKIATNDVQLFVGFGETDNLTLGESVPLADADAVTNTAAFIGFQREEDGLGVLNTVYADRATSFTEVSATEATIAALTWTRIGFVYDPNNSAKCITFYQDGVELATGITAAVLKALTYLDANPLGFTAAIFADSSGTASSLYLDWIRYAQLEVGAVI